MKNTRKKLFNGWKSNSIEVLEMPKIFQWYSYQPKLETEFITWWKMWCESMKNGILESPLACSTNGYLNSTRYKECLKKTVESWNSNTWCRLKRVRQLSLSFVTEKGWFQTISKHISETVYQKNLVLKAFPSGCFFETVAPNTQPNARVAYPRQPEKSWRESSTTTRRRATQLTNRDS